MGISVVTRSLVDRIRKLVTYGLSDGLGERGRGEMCVQACVSAALEEEHSDAPSCVPKSRREFGIWLNDADGWDDDMARGKGLKDYAIAQLGTSSRPESDFVPLVIDYAIAARFGIWAEKIAELDEKQVARAQQITTADKAIKFLRQLTDSNKDKDESHDSFYRIEDLLAALEIRGGARQANIERVMDELYDEQFTNQDLCDIAGYAVKACIKMRTEGSSWLEEYKSRKGSDAVKFLLDAQEKANTQEGNARLATAKMLTQDASPEDKEAARLRAQADNRKQAAIRAAQMRGFLKTHVDKYDEDDDF